MTAWSHRVDERVAGLRGSLDAAIALKAEQEAAAEKARREAEAAASGRKRRPTAGRGRRPKAQRRPHPRRARRPRYAASGTSAGEAQATARAHARQLRLGRRPVLVPRVAVEQGVGLELPGLQPLQRRLRHPAGAPRQQDGQRRRRLADERRDADRLGPRLHLAVATARPCGAWSHSQSTGWY